MTLRVVDQRGFEVKPHRVISAFEKRFSGMDYKHLENSWSMQAPTAVRRFFQRTIFAR